MEVWIYEAAAKSLVENIRQRMTYRRYPLTADIRENLENLLTQLEKLQLLMKDPIPRILGEILIEAEGAVDSTYVFKANSSHFRSRLSSCVLPKSRDQIGEAGERIQRLCRTVDDFNKNYRPFRQPESSSRAPQVEEVVDYQAPQVEEDRVIGFDGAAEEVVALLTGGPECLNVVSLFGLHGQGKTVLAEMVYKDPEVSNEYKIRAFVYVTSGNHKKKVLINILNSFIQSDENLIRRMSVEELKKQVYQQLEDKQYLVVLDNVSYRNEWRELKGAFPNNRKSRCRCRVLITTTNVGVDSDTLYRLKFLNEEDSRELFRWRVFGENDCPVELRGFEANILNICSGLPVAIVAAAAMVVKHQKRVDGWCDVYYRMGYIGRDYLGRTLNTQLYKQLPNHLKPCFVYLSTFPKDFEIPVWKLLRLWIAEGFIHNTGGSSSYDDLEDIAEGYLDELVAHNLLMVAKRRTNGRIRICRMNGVIYDFCKSLCDLPGGFYYARRWICTNRLYTKGTGVRSIMFYPTDENMVPSEQVLSRIRKTFKYLKVLEVESLSFTRFPYQVCTLVLLKYIVISGRIKSLPAALFDLWQLQTLIVNTTCSTLEIEADVWKMSNFRHLHTNAAASFPLLNTKCEWSQDSENNVRTLCWISSASCKKQVFDQTSKLNKLGVRGRLTELFGGEASLFSFLHKLENLKLWNDENPMNRLSGFPPKGAFPKQLTKLILSHTRLKWKEMRTVGEMESLEILKLKEYAFVGEQWKTENGGFLRLRHLHIGHTDLMVWEAAADHFPVLGSLEINGCYGLRRVPHSLADILSLQSVRLHSITSPGVTYSLKRIRLVKFLQTKQANRRKTFEISYFPQQV